MNDRIAKLDYTIVGGPSHGMRIQPSNGYEPVRTMPKASYGGFTEHVPHRFVIGENEAVVTVFSPQNLSVAVIQEFLNGGYDDDAMKSFDPIRGHFVG